MDEKRDMTLQNQWKWSFFRSVPDLKKILTTAKLIHKKNVVKKVKRNVFLICIAMNCFKCERQISQFSKQKKIVIDLAILRKICARAKKDWLDFHVLKVKCHFGESLKNMIYDGNTVLEKITEKVSFNMAIKAS